MDSTKARTQPRICETPGVMFVEGALFRRYSLYLYVPPTTRTFIVAIYDQADNIAGDGRTSFELWSPAGRQISLDNPIRGSWSEYEVQVEGSWGVWQLRVEASSPPCRNEFVVRTIGEVDLYVKPEPCVSYRGALSFSKSPFHEDSPHVFTVQVPDVQRLRLNFQLPSAPITGNHGMVVALDPPTGVAARQRWVGMNRDRFGSWEAWRMEYLEATGPSLEGLWRLTLENVSGLYHLGVEQDVRFFFTESPLMPQPARVEVFASMDDGSGPLAARLELTSTQTAREHYAGFPGSETPYVVFTDPKGSGEAFLLPEAEYRVSTSRGFEFERRTASLSPGSKTLRVSMRPKLRRTPGWYGGDCHSHSLYSDGSFTPVQVVEAARGEGLDWIVLSDHGAGHDIPTVLKAHEEALPYSEPGKFVVIPGEEFSADGFHANIINGTAKVLATDSLQQLINATHDADTKEQPLTVAWNHPLGHGKELLDDDLTRLPLVELWNTQEPSEELETTLLWWSWLGRGKRVFAETGTDSHHRAANPYGHRRTYVYLGDTPLTAANIVRALRGGRSFLSRGALLYYTVNGELPGSTISNHRIQICVEMDSAIPVGRIDIIGNGVVAWSFDVGGAEHFTGEITIDDAEGWYLAQVMDAGE
ncbi:MAG: CehA/McbA family metallohydrolase, partial [SAR202 cluster bacterium]|nr:CehA/McbA family metallohydrolase [SAR202 cluster bacterium]